MADPIPVVPPQDLETPPALRWEGGVAVLPPPVPPIDDESWVDAATTYENVLRSLRLEADDPDAQVVMAAMTAAVSVINQWLDRDVVLPGPPPPAPVQQALEQLTIELYRRKDAPFYSLNATVPEDVEVDISGTGTIQTVAPLLQPYKRRWGFA